MCRRMERLHAMDGDRTRARDIQMPFTRAPSRHAGSAAWSAEAEPGPPGAIKAAQSVIVRRDDCDRARRPPQPRGVALRPAVANRSFASSAAASSGASEPQRRRGIEPAQPCRKRFRRRPIRKGRSWSAPAGRPRRRLDAEAAQSFWPSCRSSRSRRGNQQASGRQGCRPNA